MELPILSQEVCRISVPMVATPKIFAVQQTIAAMAHCAAICSTYANASAPLDFRVSFARSTWTNVWTTKTADHMGNVSMELTRPVASVNLATGN
jgi:hypothetical protein